VRSGICNEVQDCSHTPRHLLSRIPLRFRPRTCLLPHQTTRSYANPAGHPDFVSVLDRPPILVRAGKKRHGPGLIILAAIPITAFALGCWQVQRLTWKTDLITKFSEQLTRPPLPLPPHIDTAQIPSFEYRRIIASGTLRHHQKMLIGPRIKGGENGYQIVTQLERPNGSKILVNRALPKGGLEIEGLLRAPCKKNSSTPDNRPDIGEFYFPDVEGMAKLVGAQPVWVEETMEPDLVTALDMEANGVPIGRPADVNLRNQHMQYIVTWFGLSAAASIIFYLLVRKPLRDIARRVRSTTEWS
ncbi:surf-like protein, partial [Rhizina undulata]